MFLSWMHLLCIWQFPPIPANIQKIFFILTAYYSSSELLIERLAPFCPCFFKKRSMNWRSWTQDQESFFFESPHSHSHPEVSLGVHRLQNGYLHNWHFYFRVHHHHGYENSMIISSFFISLQLNSLFKKTFPDMGSCLRRTAHLIVQIVCLRGETIVIVVKRWAVVVQESPVTLLPVGWKDYDAFGVGESGLDLFEVFRELLVLLGLEERHGASSMSDKDWSHSSTQHSVYNFLINFNQGFKVLIRCLSLANTVQILMPIFLYLIFYLDYRHQTQNQNENFHD